MRFIDGSSVQRDIRDNVVCQSMHFWQKSLDYTSDVHSIVFFASVKDLFSFDGQISTIIDK